VLHRLEQDADAVPETYAVGSDGPDGARALPTRNGHRWSRLAT
jgi:hypothetical protein